MVLKVCVMLLTLIVGRESKSRNTWLLLTLNFADRILFVCFFEGFAVHFNYSCWFGRYSGVRDTPLCF